MTPEKLEETLSAEDARELIVPAKRVLSTYAMTRSGRRAGSAARSTSPRTW